MKPRSLGHLPVALRAPARPAAEGRLSPPLAPFGGPSAPRARRRRGLCLALATGLVFGGTGSWAPAAHAQGFPVIDPANLIQSTLQAQRALEQIEQLTKQYEKQIEQLSVAIAQRDALLGGRGMGALLNGAEERAARRSVPASFEELLRTLGAEAGGVFPELRALYGSRARELDLAGAGDVNPARPEGRTARVYARERDATLANLAMSEQAFADAARRVGSYEQLMAAIDAAPDLKASTDLASRILAENGLALNELLRLQAVALGAANASRARGLVDTTNVAEVAVYESVPLEELESLASRPGNRVQGDRE